MNVNISVSGFQANLQPAVLPLHCLQLSMTGYTLSNKTQSCGTVCDDGFKTDFSPLLNFFFFLPHGDGTLRFELCGRQEGKGGSAAGLPF